MTRAPIDTLGQLLDRWNPDATAEQRQAAAVPIAEAAKRVLDGRTDEQAEAVLRRFLDVTGDHRFLQALPDSDTCYHWAALANRAIQQSGYHLRDLWRRVVRAHPNRHLFEDTRTSPVGHYSYRLIDDRLKAIAVALRSQCESPRVVVLANNSVDAACCDLACLLYDIPVIPLNVHFGTDALESIIGPLSVNIVITDSTDLLGRLQKVRGRVSHEFSILALEPLSQVRTPGVTSLHEIEYGLGPDQIGRSLAERPRLSLDDVATIMFTSGSTGLPKGISFSMFNLVSKRFCRAAALPGVGEDAKLICYLPLYHTFGRYFELLGTVYWQGTYVFPRNPSAETLLTMLPQVQPTGLISIPLRWQQIYEKCLEATSNVVGREIKDQAFRRVVGERLHWGLSAAGYLSPQVFKYFNLHGVELCSGFGMTEATGGITMTPPGEYRDNSIGKPLPGVDVRQKDSGEMEISGAYVGRYADEAGFGDCIEILPDDKDRYWLSTGDIFRRRENGHYEIVDRLKDIYKNNRGQTIAPRRVEQKLDSVPGIKRTFLVGDARANNVLLIVPDHDDPVTHGFSNPEDLRGYFDKIVSTANQDLAPYERVVDFAILDRDFSIDHGELTPKGSYKRRAVQDNFATVIEGLYASHRLELAVGDIQVAVPRWLLRDLGVLESDIEAHADGVYDRFRGIRLTLGRDEESRIRIGSLIYEIGDAVVDLGLFARQPALWIGNPELAAFCPCREGWDAAKHLSSVAVRRPTGVVTVNDHHDHARGKLSDARLIEVHQLLCRALFSDGDRALEAIAALDAQLASSDDRLCGVVRHRLEALAWHPSFDVRTAAYQVLLLDEPSKDYNDVLPAFIDSGLPFLDQNAVRKLARSKLNQRRLEALRQRLYNYRTGLTWPTDETKRRQLEAILRLLKSFAESHPEYYDPVRAELAGWILNHDDPELSQLAERLFTDLHQGYEARLAEATSADDRAVCESRLVFSEEIGAAERDRIKDVLCGTTFLRQSIMLAFDEPSLAVDQIDDEGIWISKILARRRYLRYRLSVNMAGGKHYDLQLILNEDVKQRPVLETIYWLLTISGHPYGTRVLPRLGCARPELGARSLEYVGDLTVWEKIREYSALRSGPRGLPRRNVWRKLLVRGMGAFFRAWLVSGRRIVPGTITPENVVVPTQDFQEGSKVTSITGWAHAVGGLQLVEPMLQNFIRKTVAHYPWCRDFVRTSYIFDAAMHVLGSRDGAEFLTSLKEEAEHAEPNPSRATLLEDLNAFLSDLAERYYPPLPVQNAIDRYKAWSRLTPLATASARGQILAELMRLYRFDRFGEIARYYLFLHTYFAETSEKTRAAFVTLINRLFTCEDTPARQLVELSDLQATLETADDRRVFARLVLPQTSGARKLEVLALSEGGSREVIVSTEITDKLGESYAVREPLEPAEIGHLFRLYFKAGYPKTISEQDSFLVIIDPEDQVIGGLCYRYEGDDVVHLDGSVILPSLAGRGIGTALLEDFCARMTNDGVRLIKTHFFLRNFYAKRGFEVNERWGALVRFLEPETGI